MASTTTTGIKLEPAIKKRLIALGKKRDRSPHWLMKRAIIGYIEQEEMIEQENAICEARWDEYVRTGEYISEQAMNVWFDKVIKKSKKNAGDA